MNAEQRKITNLQKAGYLVIVHDPSATEFSKKYRICQGTAKRYLKDAVVNDDGKVLALVKRVS